MQTVLISPVVEDAEVLQKSIGSSVTVSVSILLLDLQTLCPVLNTATKTVRHARGLALIPVIFALFLAHSTVPFFIASSPPSHAELWPLPFMSLVPGITGSVPPSSPRPPVAASAGRAGTSRRFGVLCVWRSL